MAISSDKLPETYTIYRLKDNASLEIGADPEFDSSDTTNWEALGTVRARVNTGDSLEPDVRGITHDHGVDLTEQWLVWFAIPSGFDIRNGDYAVSTGDSSRKFQIQFLDKYPGGVSGHHYEARFQSTEEFRNG